MTARRAIVTLLALCLVFMAAVETVTHVAYGKVSRIRARLEQEQVAARELKWNGSGSAPLLMVGNSLLLEGVQIGELQRALSPELEARRFVVEGTSYLDWYYGLRRLFREGSRPAAVVVVLSPRQFLSNSTVGDYFAHLLMDERDLLRVMHDAGYDRTVTSSLLFARASTFYGSRSEIRKWILNNIIPDLQALTSRLQPTAKPLGDSTFIETAAAPRMRRLAELGTSFGVQIIVVVPPVSEGGDDAYALQAAGKAAGVEVLVPSAPGELSVSDFADGFHLNDQGSKKFTAALARQVKYAIKLPATTALPLGSPSSFIAAGAQP